MSVPTLEEYRQQKEETITLEQLPITLRNEVENHLQFNESSKVITIKKTTLVSSQFNSRIEIIYSVYIDENSTVCVYKYTQSNIEIYSDRKVRQHWMLACDIEVFIGTAKALKDYQRKENTDDNNT